MNNIKTILICLIAIVATCAICIGLIAMNEQTTTIKLSETCSIDITGSYETISEYGLNRITVYDKFHNNKSVIIYSGANADLKEMMTFKMLKAMFVGDVLDTGAEPVKTKMDGNDAWVIYTGNNQTHDNILIISKNRDECIKMYKSIKYNTNGAKTVNNTTVEKISNDNNQQANDNQQQNTANNKKNPQTVNPGKEAQARTQSPIPSPSPSSNSTR